MGKVGCTVLVNNGLQAHVLDVVWTSCLASDQAGSALGDGRSVRGPGWETPE